MGCPVGVFSIIGLVFVASAALTWLIVAGASLNESDPDYEAVNRAQREAARQDRAIAARKALRNKQRKGFC